MGGVLQGAAEAPQQPDAAGAQQPAAAVQQPAGDQPDLQAVISDLRGLQLEQRARRLERLEAEERELRYTLARRDGAHAEEMAKLDMRLRDYREREAEGSEEAEDRAGKVADELKETLKKADEALQERIAEMREHAAEQAQRAAAPPAPCAECELRRDYKEKLEKKRENLRNKAVAAKQRADDKKVRADQLAEFQQRLTQAESGPPVQFPRLAHEDLVAARAEHAGLRGSAAVAWAQWEELYEAARLPPPQRQPGAACPAGAARAVSGALRSAPRPTPSPPEPAAPPSGTGGGS
eukprot:TRINITY_DN15308_c0_g3_i1.p1 TRINITY_DN15308_c0_g3~~TRINITY_DN15308_c0_g3_i1.p1  ORF type:complete len:320 (+),score=118.73 TRINITY_DN15308_c0_g3_i1:79-960(+)